MDLPKKLLLAEHTIRTAKSLRNTLRSVFHDVNVVFDSASVLRELQVNPPDFLIINADGLEGEEPALFVQEIRKLSDLPLLLYGIRHTPSSQLRALEAGADNFLSIYPDAKQLTIHIQVIWRRFCAAPPCSLDPQKQHCVNYPCLSINLTNYSVRCDGKMLEMPPKELELLYFLASSPNQVFTREQLLDHIWGYDYLGDARTVDVHIKRIRAKIKDHETWSLDTVWGVGYRFSFRSNHNCADDHSSPSAQIDSV